MRRLARHSLNTSLASNSNVLHAGRSQAHNQLVQRVLTLARTNGQVIASDLYRNGITPRGQPKVSAAVLDELARTGELTCEAATTARKNHTQLVYRLPNEHPRGT